MAFGFLLFPEDSTTIVQLFPTLLRSAISRFENQLTPVRVRGRKTKHERHQLKIYRGDTETLIIQVTLEDQPFDLTPYTINAQIRERADSANFIHSSTIVDGVNGTNLSQGHIVWRIPDTDTRILPIKCLFDIRGNSGTTISTICSGLFERVDDITKL